MRGWGGERVGGGEKVEGIEVEREGRRSLE